MVDGPISVMYRYIFLNQDIINNDRPFLDTLWLMLDAWPYAIGDLFSRLPFMCPGSEGRYGAMMEIRGLLPYISSHNI